MRITESERESLLQAVDEIYQGIYALRLYGSRADDNAKGGDIDLLLILPDDKVSELKMLKPNLLVAMKNKIAEQRIDLTITCLKDIKSSSFLSLVLPDSVLLGDRTS
jgi:predicted nucleotidyltransferase